MSTYGLVVSSKFLGISIDTHTPLSLLLGLSKLANTLHIKHLQHRLDSQDIPITCLAVHPGAVMTPGVSKILSNRGPIL